MKLWEKVNNITGNSNKARILVDYVNQGAKFVVSSLPEKFLWTIANEETIQGHDGSDSVIGDGSSVPYDKILAVYRFDGSTISSNTISSAGTKRRVAVEVEDNNIHIFDEASSLLRATKMFPKYYKLGGKIYIKPDPDYNSQTGATSSYTDVDGNTITVNATSGDKGIIVYAAPPLVDENTDSWILAEFENVVIQYAASLDSLYQGGVHRDKALTSLDSVTTALSSYLSSYPSHSIRDIPKPTSTFSSVTPSTSLPSVPNFNGVSLPTSLNLSTSLPSDFAITEGINSIVDLSISTPLPTIVMPSEIDISYTEISDAQAKAKSLIDDYGSIGGGDTTGEGDTQVNSQTIKSAQQWLIEEDPEMVETQMGIASQELQRASSHINSEKSKLEEYQVEVGAAQQKFAGDLQKYQAEIAEEQARIAEQLQKHQADVARETQEINSQISKYSAEVQKESSRIGVDVQTAQAEIAKLQATFNGDVQKYTTELSLKSQNLQKEVSQYTNDIQKYSSEVQAEVQAYSTDVKKRERFIQEAGIHMQKSQSYMGVSQQQYGISAQYYQKAISELQAITGTLAAPPQQQKGQRQEERKSS